MSDDKQRAGRDLPLSALLLRGVVGRCPQCGRGRLFHGLLDVVKDCAHCGLRFSDHDVGDGPAVAGTFIIGFIALAAAVILELSLAPPLWVHVAVSAPLIFGGSLGVLRPLKGLTVAIQYRYRDVDKPTPPGGG